MSNYGDRRPASCLPGYDPDWRSPHNMQVYPDPLLDLDLLLNFKEYDRLNVQRDIIDRIRVVTRNDIAAAFALMMGLADDRLVSEKFSFCDPAERPVARAYQAAIKVICAYYLDKRLKVGPAYLAAARIVCQCVDTELYTCDLIQKRRELAALEKGRSTQLSPGTNETVPAVLARWRDLQIGEPFEGSRLDAVARQFNRDRSTISESVNIVAIPKLQERFGRYCNNLAYTPPQADPLRYTVFKDGRNQRTDHPQPAVAPPIELPDGVFLGAWRAEALEYWGYWGDATKCPQGLADGATTAAPCPHNQDFIEAGFKSSGARNYGGSDGYLIWHPQPAADWSAIVAELPDGKRKNELRDQNAAIEKIVNEKIPPFDSVGHHWTSEPDPPPSPAVPLYFGPVRKVGHKLNPRPYERDDRPVDAGSSFWNEPAKRLRSRI